MGLPPRRTKHVPTRNILITAADGQTGHLIAELLLQDDEFSSKFKSLTLLASDPSKCKDLVSESSKAAVVKYQPGHHTELVKAMRDAHIDTVLLIPPARQDKAERVKELVEAVREVGVRNTILLSSAGCDLAERDKQPNLRQFIDFEQLMMINKGDTSTEAGHSPCIIRAGFYAENLLLYNKQTQNSGKLPLPIGSNHKFAPVALGDIAQVAAHVLTGRGPHGLADAHRGQLIVVTGPMLTAGKELAAAAADALGVKMEFQDITEGEAKKILAADENIDPSEAQYLLEYYSLVREGKTNYVSTTAYKAITGSDLTQPSEFFKTYEQEFKPKRRRLSNDD